MTRADRLAHYSTRLVALEQDGTLSGLARQGDYGYRVYRGPWTVDYWPGRGTWRTPDGKHTGTGWLSLMHQLEIYGQAP